MLQAVSVIPMERTMKRLAGKTAGMMALLTVLVLTDSCGRDEKSPTSPAGYHNIVTMIPIPAGTFLMGSNDWQDDEKPVHEVILDAFAMSETEITRGQYRDVTGINLAATARGDSAPVVNVSWHEAVQFCNLLSDMAGLERCYDEDSWECDFTRSGFRLPTEAEWEYACRAGTTTMFCTGDSERGLEETAWFVNNIGNATAPHPVGLKNPNGWGLYDMHGNVWEWCNDWYDSGYYHESPASNPTGPGNGDFRVRRGGDFGNNAFFCRSANRFSSWPGTRSFFLGFRIVRSGSFNGASGGR